MHPDTKLSPFPQPPQVVLLCGISGSGKTFYAKALETKGYMRLSADEIAWRRYGSGLQSMSPEQQQAAYADANRKLLNNLEQALQNNRMVVVDSTLCKRYKRDEMRELCRSYGIEPQLVYMKATKETLLRRLAQRNGIGANDQCVTPSQLENFHIGFEAPEDDEEALLIFHK